MKITLKTAEKRCFLLIASADLDRLNPLCFTSPAALKKADPLDQEARKAPGLRKSDAREKKNQNFINI